MKDDIQAKINNTRSREPQVVRKDDDNFTLVLAKQHIDGLTKIDLMKIRNVINLHLRRF